jgi:hypothetical protein
MAGGRGWLGRRQLNISCRQAFTAWGLRVVDPRPGKGVAAKARHALADESQLLHCTGSNH